MDTARRNRRATLYPDMVRPPFPEEGRPGSNIACGGQAAVGMVWLAARLRLRRSGPL